MRLFCHDLEFCIGGGAGVPAHGMQTHGAVGHLGVYIGGDAVFEEVQVGFGGGPVERQVHRAVGKVGIVPEFPRPRGAEGGPAKAIRGQKLGGDTLAQSSQLVAASQQGEFRVYVDVDKPGTDNLSLDVDEVR